MEKGLLSTVNLPDNQNGIVNVFPTDQGIPLVKIDSTVYHADKSKASLPVSFATDTKNGGVSLSFRNATYSAGDSFAILSHVDGILTVKESQDRWYTRRDEGRHIVYETLFCQYDESGNPVSRFKVVATSCPIKRPCQVGGCEWASLRTIAIGETVFEGVYMANLFSGADGELYAILVYTDGAKLYRINPGYSDVEFADLDSMEDPYHTCKNCGGAEGEVPSASSSSENGQAIRQTSTNEIMHPTLTPDEVLFRANAMANFQWTLMEGHLTVRTKVKTENGVDVTYYSEEPKYIAEADVGDTLTGIPYCHGGHNGYDGWSTTDFRYDSFANRICEEYSSGNWYTAGNVNHCGYIRRTLGLDCSAFVGSAYDYHGELGVSGVSKYGHEVNDWSELQCMDALVSDNHCMLFYGLGEGNLIEVIDCTGVPLDPIYMQEGVVQPDEKVQRRQIPQEYFEGYIFKSVFFQNFAFVDVNNHTWFCSECDPDAEEGILKNHTISYNYNSTRHWAYCADGCGYNPAASRPHTLQYGVCTVCGYSQNALNTRPGTEVILEQ